MKYIISILFLLISVASYGQRISELSTTTDGRDGRIPIIRPSGSPSGWTTFAISYDNLVQYLETDIADNLSRIGEVSDSLTIAYDTVFDAWTAIVEIRTRNDNQTDSLEALYDTAAVHLDTLILHRNQITSILSDLGGKLEETDTINYSDTSFTVKFSDGYILDDSLQIVDCDNLHVEISSTNNGVIDCDNAFVTLTGYSNKDVTWAWQGSISGSLGSTREISAITPETVTLTVTDQVTGCQDDTSIVIGFDAVSPTVDIIVVGTVDTTNKFISIAAIGDDLTGYQWSDGATGQIRQVKSSATYFVTVTDENNGCTHNESIVIDLDDYTQNASSDSSSITYEVDSLRSLSGSDISIDSNAVFQEKTTFQRTEQVWDSIAFSSTMNLDFTDGSDYKMVVVTGDITINVTDLYGGESVLWIIQDGTGSHTVTKGTGWGDLRGSGTISTDADAISVVQWQKAVGPGAYTKVIHWID